MSRPCKLGIPQMETARKWCDTHNQMLHFCSPDPNSTEGIMQQSRKLVKDFWLSLPEPDRTLWLLDGPCEVLVENVFAALSNRAATAKGRLNSD